MKRTLIIAAFAAVACNAFAGVNVLTSRPAGTDDLDWGQLGANGAAVANGSIANTVGTPFKVKVSSDSALYRWDQPTSWAGDFASGDKLISNVDPSTWNAGRTIELLGEKTCIDMGAQIQSFWLGDFTARIQVWNGLGDLIGDFSQSGVSGQNGDGSTMFLGVHSDSGDIHRVGYSLTASNGNGFALNHVTYNCCAPVPEPASMSILGLGAAALLRRKAKKA